MLITRKIKEAAAAVGFDASGVCRASGVDGERAFFEDWLGRGFNAGLDYLERNIDKRFDPALLVPGARSVIVCGVVYKNSTSLGYGGECRTKVASYARTTDYHVTIKQMLHELSERLGLSSSGVRFRAFTDTAPLLEKRLAREAGLGFIGRNKLLVSPRFGSFMLLGELVTDADSDEYDVPYDGVGCGDCRRCIEACPTQALTPQGLDARRCVARVTIEPHPERVPSLAQDAVVQSGWIFGCDVCQSVCPYNAKSPEYSNPRFAPLFDPSAMSADDWLQMTDGEFDALFAATPMSRSGLARIRQLLTENDG